MFTAVLFLDWIKFLHKSVVYHFKQAIQSIQYCAIKNLLKLYYISNQPAWFYFQKCSVEEFAY